MQKTKLNTLFLVVTFSIIFGSVSCNAQKHDTKVIGENQRDAPVITMDFETLKDKWEAVLLHGGVEMNISEVEIVQNRDGSYLLMSSNSDNTIFACISLVLIGDEFHEQLIDTDAQVGGGLTVSCSGCALGCHPEIIGGKGYCTPLCTNCTKTETLTSGPVLD